MSVSNHVALADRLFFSDSPLFLLRRRRARPRRVPSLAAYAPGVVSDALPGLPSALIERQAGLGHAPGQRVDDVVEAFGDGSSASLPPRERRFGDGSEARVAAEPVRGPRCTSARRRSACPRRRSGTPRARAATKRSGINAAWRRPRTAWAPPSHDEGARAAKTSGEETRRGSCHRARFDESLFSAILGIADEGFAQARRRLGPSRASDADARGRTHAREVERRGGPAMEASPPASVGAAAVALPAPARVATTRASARTKRTRLPASFPLPVAFRAGPRADWNGADDAPAPAPDDVPEDAGEAIRATREEAAPADAPIRAASPTISPGRRPVRREGKRPRRSAPGGDEARTHVRFCEAERLDRRREPRVHRGRGGGGAQSEVARDVRRREGLPRARTAWLGDFATGSWRWISRETTRSSEDVSSVSKKKARKKTRVAPNARAIAASEPVPNAPRTDSYRAAATTSSSKATGHRARRDERASATSHCRRFVRTRDGVERVLDGAHAEARRHVLRETTC